jgi:hypothetical protein
LVRGLDYAVAVVLGLGFALDWDGYLHKYLVVFALDVAKRAYHNRVELSDQILHNPMVGLFSLSEVVIDSVEEVYKEIISVVLVVSSKLNKNFLTGLRL